MNCGGGSYQRGPAWLCSPADMIALPVGKILINCCHHVFICACGCSSFPVSSHHHVSVCPVYCRSHCRLIFPRCSCPCCFLHTFSSFLKPSVRPVLRQILSRNRHISSTGAALHESLFRIIPMCLTPSYLAPPPSRHFTLIGCPSKQTTGAAGGWAVVQNLPR